MKGMAGVEDMMAGMKSTTGVESGAESGAESTRDGNMNEGDRHAG